MGEQRVAAAGMTASGVAIAAADNACERRDVCNVAATEGPRHIALTSHSHRDGQICLLNFAAV